MSFKNYVPDSARASIMFLAIHSALAQAGSPVETGSQPLLDQRQMQVAQNNADTTQTPVVTAQEQAAADTMVTLTPNGGMKLGPVTVKLGGFAEAAAIYRTRNEVADVGSDFNAALPFANSPLYHENEFLESSRQSRLSGLVTADVDEYTHLGLYAETDFLGNGTSSNSRESNSYVLRMRQFYTTLDKDNWGFHFLAGQTWSLLTTETKGMMPHNEQIPLTIDAQYIAGFNWTRNPQLRFVKSFGDVIWGGLSIESPQAVISEGGTPKALKVNVNNTGGTGTGLTNSATTYSNDQIPDIVGKLAFDPGWGHYELKGVARFFTDQVIAGGDDGNQTTTGGGVGAAASLPVVPKILDFQASVLDGHGIGRYGSAQLPDVTLGSNGTFRTIPELQALLGLIAHPRTGTDLYLYGGREQAKRTATSNGMGYGAALTLGSNTVDATGCGGETATGACSGLSTSRVDHVAAGIWQNVYKGSYGRFALGFEAEYVKKYTFSIQKGSSPTSDDTIFMTSVRYYPFS